MLKKLPHPLSILMLIVLLAAVATWLIPAGKYDTLSYEQGNTFTLTHDDAIHALPFTQHTLDSLHIRIGVQSFKQGDIRKPISVPGTYHRLHQNKQGLVDIIEAPIKGVYETIDIILFLLLIGGFINVFYATGAMDAGISHLSVRMKGREGWLIIILTFLFSFGGGSYGMAEEGLAFYPIVTPLFLAAGYDLLIPVAVIFGGTQLGTLASFSNPFSTIIASNAAGISWTDGLVERLVLFVLVTALFIGYIMRYANKVRLNPHNSFVYRYDGILSTQQASTIEGTAPKLTAQKRVLLLIFLLTFLALIGGVVFLHWWLLEMSAIFLVSSVIVALLQRMGEQQFIQKFIQGAEGMLGVTLIIGTARGVTLLLNGGNISDSILFYASQLISHLPHPVFILLLLVLYLVFTLFISSSSGMAVLTMPIIGSLAFIAGIPGREIVNSYLFGMGITGFISPTGLILPTLALVGISAKSWWKFIWPFLAMLLLLCSLFLIVGIMLR